MARLAATLGVPRFGSCFAAFRATAALVIFPWKLSAAARLGTMPKSNAVTATPTTSVRRRACLAALEVKAIEYVSGRYLPVSRRRRVDFVPATSLERAATCWTSSGDRQAFLRRI